MREYAQHRCSGTTLLFASLSITLGAHRAFARSAQGDTWATRTELTGDWGGLRTKLRDLGISVNANYASEGAAIVYGGPRRAGRYTQQLELETDFDLDRLAGISDARIQFTLTDRFGHSLSNDVLHNEFSVQELYGAGQNFRLAELNYQQDFAHRHVHLEVGWSPLGDDFARLPQFCKFQNGVICGHANAMTTNSGAHNFPIGQWGAHVKLYPLPGFYVATGLYRVNPDAGNRDKGFDLSFSGTGVFVPVELGWESGREKGGLPGIYKVGAYYNSSQTPDVYQDVNGMPAGLTGAPLMLRNGRYGAYFIASQTVYRPEPQSPRNLRIGLMMGEGDRATSPYSYFLLTGGVWQGTFPGRDQDFISFLAAYARTNPRLTLYQRQRASVSPGTVGVQTYESILEVDYGALIAPWFTLRPNLQYVIRPGGTGAIRNALVFGLSTQVTL